MKFKIALSLLAFSLMIACKSQKENVTQKTEETVKVEEIKEAKFNISEIVGFYEITFLQDAIELNEVKPTINFDGEGKFSGHNGCNSYFGSLDPSEETVVSDIGSTRMACEGVNGDVETMLMEKLKEITRIENMPPNQVHFYINGEVVIKANRIRLEGNFKVMTLAEKSLANTDITFSIAETQLSGNTGCNSFLGALIQNGYEVNLSGVAATEMVCENFDMKIEAEFLNALSKANRYEVNENQYDFFQNKTLVFSALRN